MDKIKKENGSNLVSLGQIIKTDGVCRHRALLFKYLADASDGLVRARLIRGNYGSIDQSGGVGGEHSWNVCQIGDEHCLVDVMHDTAEIVNEDSPVAVMYRRRMRDDVRGGGGKESIPARDCLLLTEKEWNTDVVKERCKFLKWPDDGTDEKCGGFSSVKVCVWRGKRVVVKQLINSTDAYSRRAMVLEAEFLRTHDHANIVSIAGVVYGDVNIADDLRPYVNVRVAGKVPTRLLVEYANSGDMHEFMRKHREQLSPLSIGLLALQLARALQYCHECEPPVVHRDLKPGNVLAQVDNVGDITRVLLADFGLAREYRAADASGATTLNKQVGTLHYMAPEQRQPEAGVKLTVNVDTYAFGLMLPELFSGRLYPKIDHITRRPDWTLPVELPRVLHGIVDQCKHEQPNKRPPMSRIVRTLMNFVDAAVAEG
jgi:hypothetical protein